MRERVNYLATVHSRVEVKIQAQTAGKVVRLPVAEGGRALAGEVIAELHSPELGDRQEKVNAELEKARTERDFVCEIYASDLKLVRAEALPRRQAETSGKNCAVAEAGLAAAAAGRKELDSLAAKTVETAPFTGMALQWLAEPGQNVMPGQPLLIFGNEELEARVQVSEMDIRRGIMAGLPVLVLLPERGESRLSVTSVAPQARGPGRSVEVRIDLPSELAEGLFHGMSLEVWFVLREEAAAVAVPRRALQSSGPDHFIFLVEDDQARRIKVEPGISEGGWVAVHPAPPDGAWVAVSGLETLSDGMDLFVVQEGVPGP